MSKSEKTPTSVKTVQSTSILLDNLDVINFSIHTAFGEDLKEGYCPWLLSDSTWPGLDPQPTQSEIHNSLRLAVSGNTDRLCLHTFVLTTDEALWVWHEFALKLYCRYLYTRPCLINHIWGLKQLWLQANGHAWFHLQRLRWPIRIGEGAKNSKWKYMSPAGFEPTLRQSTTGKLQRLRPLGHAG